MLTISEENYLKALYRICNTGEASGEAGTNALAQELEVKPATVHEMLKRLKEKRLVSQERYGKIRLTAAGRRHAVEVIRKHRLWETFLFEKLRFTWDEVHEVAEQLEHIRSVKLVDRLDEFLGHPKTDPHGDPIPDRQGRVKEERRIRLCEAEPGKPCRVRGVTENGQDFLQYLDRMGIRIGSRIRVLMVNAFDGSLDMEMDGRRRLVTRELSENILVAEV